MKPDCERMLYYCLWIHEDWLRPRYRTVGETFPQWVRRRGLARRLAHLEEAEYLERGTKAKAGGRRELLRDRLLRLTEAGRVKAVGGRHPERAWSRPWDRKWRWVVYDLAASEGSLRGLLRDWLSRNGFAWAQRSVWISPDPLPPDLLSRLREVGDPRTILVVEGVQADDPDPMLMVRATWDWAAIDGAYRAYLAVLGRLPDVGSGVDGGETALRCWWLEERESWLAAVTMDPLLPRELCPPGYLGFEAWRRKLEVMRRVALPPSVLGEEFLGTTV